MMVSICYRCGSCGCHDLFKVPAWGTGPRDTYRLCANCVDDLQKLKFKVENISKSEVSING